MHRMGPIWLLVAATLVLAPLPATAGDRAVGVFVTPRTAAAGDGAALLEGLLRQQIPGLEGVALRTSARAPRDVPAKARELVEEGYRALNGGQPAAALTALSQAQERLAAHHGRMDLRLRARALKGLAVALALTGKRDEAQGRLRDSLVAFPAQQASEYEWSQDLVNLFGFVKAQVDGDKPGAVEITSTPAGAKVIFDGRERGRTPVTIEELRPGSHWLELELDGHRRMARAVEVKAEETAKVADTFAEHPERARIEALVVELPKARKAADAGKLAAELRGHIDADAVLVLAAAPTRQGFQLKGWFAEGDTVKPVTATLARDAAMLGKAQELLAVTLGAKVAAGGGDEASAPLGGPPKGTVLKVAGATGAEPIGPGGKPGAKDKVAAGPEWYETWWFWTAVGGVVVAGATAAILAVALAEDDVPRIGNVVIDLHAIE